MIWATTESGYKRDGSDQLIELIRRKHFLLLLRRGVNLNQQQHRCEHESAQSSEDVKHGMTPVAYVEAILQDTSAAPSWHAGSMRRGRPPIRHTLPVSASRL